MREQKKTIVIEDNISFNLTLLFVFPKASKIDTQKSNPGHSIEQIPNNPNMKLCVQSQIFSPGTTTKKNKSTAKLNNKTDSSGFFILSEDPLTLFLNFDFTDFLPVPFFILTPFLYSENPVKILTPI